MDTFRSRRGPARVGPGLTQSSSSPSYLPLIYFDFVSPAHHQSTSHPIIIIRPHNDGQRYEMDEWKKNERRARVCAGWHQSEKSSIWGFFFAPELCLTWSTPLPPAPFSFSELGVFSVGLPLRAFRHGMEFAQQQRDEEEGEETEKGRRGEW